MPADSINANLSETIESALSGLGEEARKIILEHIKEKYGMNIELILQYREEFANYLREIIGDSAEIIIGRLDKAVPKAQYGHTDSGIAEPLKILAEKVPGGVFFVMCEYCFWCATLLRYRSRPRCHACNKRIRDAVPISSGESFGVNIDGKRGLTLSFW